MRQGQPPVRERMTPPRVDIRRLREAHGLTIPALVERIREQGYDVTADHISNCELGWKRPSNSLLHAWAKALGLLPLDVHLNGVGPSDQQVPA